MLLSSLTRKEKLKFLDLAIHIASVDGSPDVFEKRLLDIMVAEVGDNIASEYHFNLGGDLDETLNFFQDSSKETRRIVYMNLFKISIVSTVYTTDAHFLLEDIRDKLGISLDMKTELLKIIYDERDLREKALRLVRKK